MHRLWGSIEAVYLEFIGAIVMVMPGANGITHRRCWCCPDVEGGVVVSFGILLHGVEIPVDRLKCVQP